jgi:hypothetical protein
MIALKFPFSNSTRKTWSYCGKEDCAASGKGVEAIAKDNAIAPQSNREGKQFFQLFIKLLSQNNRCH